MKRQARSAGRSLLSAVYAPLVLSALLMAVSVLRGGPGDADFGPMLVMGTVAYLGGVFALRHEFIRGNKLRNASIYRTEPLYHGVRHVTLGDDALESSAPNISTLYRYVAFTDVEVVHGLIVGWIGNAGAILVPVRAFSSASEADAYANDMRNRIIAARKADANGPGSSGP